MANVKMPDASYLEATLKGTGSVIIIANDQLRSTTLYLLSFLLEIVSVAIRWVSKTWHYNFKSSPYLSVALTFHCVCFFITYMDESLNNQSKNLGKQWKCISLEIPAFEEK